VPELYVYTHQHFSRLALAPATNATFNEALAQYCSVREQMRLTGMWETTVSPVESAAWVWMADRKRGQAGNRPGCARGRPAREVGRASIGA
jgi:hypothetical protein